MLLNEIGYNEEFKENKFKKSAVHGLWIVLMHLILWGLSRKHDATDMVRKGLLYVVYSIYSRRSNIVDFTEVLWEDFRKFSIKRKLNEISSPRFQALLLQQLYRERREPIHIKTDQKEVFLFFKANKTYRLPNQFSFGPTRWFPRHMLAVRSSDS